MTLQHIIAPSILNANFGYLAQEIKQIEQGGAGYVHLDIMDGNFVPNISFGPSIVKCVNNITDLPLDAHLMICNPEQYIPEFAAAGADIITIQAESTNHLDRAVHLVKEHGCKVGVTLNPATPLQAILHVAPIVDMVLIMSVNPGFGGQSLIPYCLDKVRTLRELHPELDIQIDGGINLQTIHQAKQAGANIFVVGSAIFGTNNPEATTQQFVQAVQS
jgi:ribulose-phosphate 3-epimerase